eukprot:3323766-Amphidinium_carterae.3
MQGQVQALDECGDDGCAAGGDEKRTFPDEVKTWFMDFQDARKPFMVGHRPGLFRDAHLLALDLFTGVNVNVANHWKRKEKESKAGRPKMLQDGCVTVLSYQSVLLHFGLYSTCSLLR